MIGYEGDTQMADHVREKLNEARYRLGGVVTCGPRPETMRLSLRPDPNALFSTIAAANAMAASLRENGWVVKVQPDPSDANRLTVQVSITAACDPSPPKMDPP